MTRPLPSGILVAVLLLALIGGGLMNYCMTRTVAEEAAVTPTISVIVLPTLAPSPVPATATPVPTLAERLPATVMPTATSTATPEPTPILPTATPSVERSPVQRG